MLCAVQQHGFVPWFDVAALVVVRSGASICWFAAYLCRWVLSGQGQACMEPPSIASGVMNRHVCIYLVVCSCGGHRTCMPAVVSLPGVDLCLYCMHAVLMAVVTGCEELELYILTGCAVCAA